MNDKNKKNLFTMKNINACLNAAECVMDSDRFITPYIALNKMVQLFFNQDNQLKSIRVDTEKNRLIVTDENNKKVIDVELKQSFVDKVFPHKKNEREQLPGQISIDEFITPKEKEISIDTYMETMEQIEEAKEIDYIDEINEKYKDPYYFEEMDR